MSSTLVPTPERLGTATEPTVVVGVGDFAELERQFSRLNAQGAEVEEVLGCSLTEARDLVEDSGDLSLAEIIEQGQLGRRGLAALDRALAERMRRIVARRATAVVTHRPRSGRAPRRSRRIATAADSSRGSPRLGDSDESDPEPPLRRCPGCDREFTPKRPNQKHCDGVCKQRAYNRRKRELAAAKRALAEVDMAALRERQEAALLLRRRGEITGEDALLLVVRPTPDVLELQLAARRFAA
jgi:hypothetical protein